MCAWSPSQVQARQGAGSCYEIKGSVPDKCWIHRRLPARDFCAIPTCTFEIISSNSRRLEPSSVPPTGHFVVLAKWRAQFKKRFDPSPIMQSQLASRCGGAPLHVRLTSTPRPLAPVSGPRSVQLSRASAPCSGGFLSPICG